GSYLAELLLDKGYEVVGVVRRSSAPNLWRIEHLLERITLRPGDLLDQQSLMRIIQDVRPHEFYNLAAMSFVPASWDQPMLTGEFNSLGVTRVLEAIRQVDPGIRLYQASSSERSGSVRQDPSLLRPAEVDHLIGDPAKARTVLGWTPSVNFEQLISMMVDADIERLAHSPLPRPVIRTA